MAMKPFKLTQTQILMTKTSTNTQTHAYKYHHFFQTQMTHFSLIVFCSVLFQERKKMTSRAKAEWREQKKYKASVMKKIYINGAALNYQITLFAFQTHIRIYKQCGKAHSKTCKILQKSISDFHLRLIVFQ